MTPTVLPCLALVRTLAVVAAIAMTATVAAAQPVSVTGATPPTGEQDTVGLVVRVTGRNFAPGARADFFKSKTSDPAGVTVRETRFVSATELDAVLDIAPTAELSYFDVRVTNLAGRSGKGSDLFQVIQRGPVGCVLPAPPPGFSSPLRLNTVLGSDVARFSGLGGRIVSRPVTVNGQDAVMVATPSTAGIELFFLSDGGGSVAVNVAHPQLTVAVPGLTQVQWMTLAELNEDPASPTSTPDLVVGSSNDQAVYVLRGSRSGAPEVISYGAPQVLRSGVTSIQYGYSVAAANLDGAVDPQHEIVVSELGGRSKGKLVPGTLHIYDHNGALLSRLTPTPSSPLTDNDLVGRSIALADVTGDGLVDLVAGVPGRAPAGQVWIFAATAPATFPTTPRVVEIDDAVAGLRFGRMVATGLVNADGVADLLGTTDWTTAGIRGAGTEGPIVGSSTATAPIYAFNPVSQGAGQGWARGGFSIADFDGDGVNDVVVGAAHADYLSGCGSTGVVYLFRQCTSCAVGAPRWEVPILLGPQERTSNTLGQFGHGGVVVAQVGAVRVLVVSDFAHTVGSTSAAGQVYVYQIVGPF